MSFLEPGSTSHYSANQNYEMQIDDYNGGNMYGNCRINEHNEIKESHHHNINNHSNNNNQMGTNDYNVGNMYQSQQSGYNTGNMYYGHNPVMHQRGRGRGFGRGMRGRGWRGRMHHWSGRGRRRVIMMNSGLQLISSDYSPPKQTGRSLTKQHKVTFRDIGCVVIKNAVPPDVIEKTLRKINYSLGKGFHLRNINPQTGQPLFSNELLKSPEMINLFTQSDAYSLCADLFGVEHGVIIKNNRCQVALRYPEHPDTIPLNKNEYKEDEQNWHIDGFNNRNLPQFNILCGISLSKQSIPFCGQFTYWPGTHYDIQRTLIQTGYEEFWEKNHKPEGRNRWKDVEFEQCNVDVGDVILCHPFLCHKGGTNYSMNIRYNVYYRIQHKDFNKMTDNQRINNLWLALDGLKDVL